jgi:hypothetical protein
MFVIAAAEYPKIDEDKPSKEALLHEHERYTSTLSRAPPPPRNAALSCPLPEQSRHLKWWLAMVFADNFDISYTYAEMGNDKHTELQLQFQDWPNLAMFATTPQVGGTGLTLTIATYAVITQKFRVMAGLSLTIAWVV